MNFNFTPRTLLLFFAVPSTIYLVDFLMWAFENPEEYILLIETTLRNFIEK